MNLFKVSGNVTGLTGHQVISRLSLSILRLKMKSIDDLLYNELYVYWMDK